MARDVHGPDSLCFVLPSKTVLVVQRQSIEKLLWKMREEKGTGEYRLNLSLDIRNPGKLHICLFSYYRKI